MRLDGKWCSEGYDLSDTFFNLSIPDGMLNGKRQHGKPQVEQVSAHLMI